VLLVVYPVPPQIAVVTNPIPATDCNIAYKLPDVTAPPYVDIKAAIPLVVNPSPFTAGPGPEFFFVSQKLL
ncbi:9826_t:CDS:1, partial [Ambispora leptoticha]